MAHGLFLDLVLVYAIALVVMIASGRIGVPAVIALIGTGILAGPSALQIISTPGEVEQLAEIGVVLLLFTIGLDFPMGKLQQVWRSVVVGGVLQVTVTATAAAALGWAAGLGIGESTFVGLFVALSSTAIVLKELARHNRLDSVAGRLATGILLFQDLCVVLLLFAAPILAGNATLGSVPAILGKAALAIAAIVAIARLGLPLLFKLVTACGQREAFPLAVLVGSVGTAAVGASLGLSMALGAFLAGLVLSESEFSHQAHSEVRPLRDLLTSLFFISLGMLIDLSAVVRYLPLILGIAIAAVLVKAVIAGGALLLAGASHRVAAVSALYLAQVGEFSFVLGRDAVELGVVSQATWQVLLPASILTMLAAPTLVGMAPRVIERLRLPAPADADATTIPVERNAVIVLGFGVGGRMVARALRAFDMPYRILDMNGAAVREARAAGEPITYGDATAADTLEASGVAQARAVVSVLSDPDAALKVVSTVHRLAPDVPVLVRVRYRSEAARVEAAGAIAVAEELEASLEVLAQLLTRLAVPGNLVADLIDDYRRQEAVPARHKEAPRMSFEMLAPDLLTSPVATHQLAEGDWASGRSLGESRLRSVTGVSVLAVQHDGHHVPSPGADLRLEAGDVLYLLGNEAEIQVARRRLTGGP